LAKAASLLARITKPELAVARRHIPASELRDDILSHLRGMCGTRQGSMLTRPDFGIPDVTEMLHNFPEAIAMMQRALKHTIEAYEPRLTNVRVTFVQPDVTELVVRFEIAAQVVTDTGKAPMKFETTMEVSRKISVK
jgi:type VI secretion system protein